MDCKTALKQFKCTLIRAPILAMPNFDVSFVFKTVASNMAVGSVVVQHDQLVAFMSKAPNSAQQNYHTTDHKLFSIAFVF